MLSLHEIKNGVIFNGLYGQVDYVTVSEEDAATYNLGCFGKYKFVMPHVQVQFDLMAVVDIGDREAIRTLSSIEMDQKFLSLGTGYVCHGCGTYSAAGIHVCRHCGDLLQERPFITPQEFPFFVSRFTANSSMDDLTTVEISFASRGRVVRDIPFLGLTSVLSMPQTTSFPTGYYLCRYCGMAVPEGEMCPGCGGPRQPLREIVKLERKCIYCGTMTAEGIVCTGCGARIRGLTVKEATRGRRTI